MGSVEEGREFTVGRICEAGKFEPVLKEWGFVHVHTMLLRHRWGAQRASPHRVWTHPEWVMDDKSCIYPALALLCRILKRTCNWIWSQSSVVLLNLMEICCWYLERYFSLLTYFSIGDTAAVTTVASCLPPCHHYLSSAQSLSYRPR